MSTSRLRPLARVAYAYFCRAASSLISPLLLLVRLYWGWQFAQTGWGKLHALPHVTQFFTSLNIPFPAETAVFIGWLELAGGTLLFFGLSSRVTAFLLFIDMLTAYLTSDMMALRSILSDPGKFYNADAYTFLFAALLILIFGPGKFAIDSFLPWRYRPGAYSEPVDAASPRERSRKQYEAL